VDQSLIFFSKHTLSAIPTISHDGAVTGVCEYLNDRLEFGAAEQTPSVFRFSTNYMSQLRFFYNQRGVLASLPLILAVFITYGETQEGLLAWAIGLTIFFLGLFGRIWAQQHLHYRLKMAITLTRTGPYALLRNPIYVSNTLMSVGLTVTSRLLWMVPVTLLWCVLIFSIVVREEESRVVKVFGQPYADYLKDVPRWLPRGTQQPLGLVNEHLAQSIRAELYNLLYLLPFLIKEIVRWY